MAGDSNHTNRSGDMRARSALVACAWALALGCGPASTSGGAVAAGAQPSVSSAAADSGGAAASSVEAASLPAGVLARKVEDGRRIEVVERDGLRMLLIENEVQAAVSLTTKVGGDPLARLVRAVHKGQRSVLLLGLGSGRTATQLRDAGLNVHVVERHAAVIEFAKAHFGYRGQVAHGDGVQELDKADARYDFIIIDGWEPKLAAAVTLPRDMSPPIEESSLQQQRRAVGKLLVNVLSQRLTEDGVFVLRAVAAPESRSLVKIRGAVRRTAKLRYQQLLGDGVADERQNMVLLGSKKPINVVNLEGSMWWPMGRGDRAVRHQPAVPASPVLASAVPVAKKQVTISGYLIRLSNGSLAIDLPHYEMGAVRFLLDGAASESLRRHLSPGLVFPTRGDIVSDGDVSKTLQPFLGGGGVKRSDTRFSPVAVQVSGKARIASIVHPNAASKVPASLRGDATTDERLPYGGTLYQLDVSSIGWHRNVAMVGKLRGALSKDLKSATRDIQRAEFSQRKQLRGGPLDKVVDSLLGQSRSWQQLFPGARVRRAELLDRIGVALSVADDAVTVHEALGAAMSRAIRCDNASQSGIEWGRDWADKEALLASLRRCAKVSYQQVIRSGPDAAKRLAAGRLVILLERFGNGSAADRMRAKALRKRFPLLRVQSVPIDPGVALSAVQNSEE